MGPLPWASAFVIPLVLGELAFQRKRLQIHEAAMQDHIKTFGQDFKNQLDAQGISVGMRKYLVGLPGNVKFGAVIAAEVAASEVSKVALKFIPIVGSIAGGGTSAAVTYHQLTTGLNAHKEIALKKMKV